MYQIAIVISSGRRWGEGKGGGGGGGEPADFNTVCCYRKKLDKCYVIYEDKRERLLGAVKFFTI